MWKTSVLSILNKFIGDQSTSNAFTYDDFNIAFKSLLWNAVITSDFVWNKNIPRGIELYLYIEREINDNLSNIEKITLDLDPINNIVVLEFEYVLSDEDLKGLADDYQTYKAKHEKQDEQKCFEKCITQQHRKFFKTNN